MSKSKGNFFTARDLFAKGIEPAALRLELIRTHYRTNANFTFQGLADTQRMVDRWRRIAAGTAGDTEAAATARRQCTEGFAAAMNDDLNIAAAIGVLNSWTGNVAEPSAADAAFINQLDGVLGVLGLDRPETVSNDIGVFAAGLNPDPSVEDLLRKRRDARAAKDFKASDLIRDQLAAMGYAIKDMAGGKVEVRRA